MLPKMGLHRLPANPKKAKCRAKARSLALVLGLGLALGSADAQAQSNPPPSPPRVDGIHLGLALEGQSAFIRVTKEFDTEHYSGAGASLWVGEQVYRWLALGLRVGYSRVSRGERSAGVGWLQLDAGFYPFHRWTPKEHQVSFRVRTGLGGGFITIPEESGRKGMGGAAVGTAIRYEWFPWARCNRPRVGGGFAIAPEISFTGYPPVSKGSSWGVATQFGVAALFHFGS